jgi:cation diffusion facilitator CzcD-associated flavoprotein CzcO
VTGLAELEAALRRDLALTAYPARDWLPRRSTSQGAPVLDVLIVGAGQSGLAVAASLMRERVTNLAVVDEHEEDRAGPWRNFARMLTLRTPKYVTGPDLGIPSLTIQSWYEAQHGHGAWEALGLVPKELWADYLAWFRQVLQIPVRSQTRVGALRWLEHERCFEVPLHHLDSDEHTLTFARRVVLATGIEGSGHWHVPRFISDALPPQLYAHTRDDIDFAALRGKRVAVLGAGASAFDNAAVALEHGASEVRLCFRRGDLVRVNAYRWAEFVGFLKHLGDLPDADKWRFVRQILAMGQLPPADTVARARRHAGFQIDAGNAFRGLRAEGDQLVVTSDGGEQRHDFLIVATGFRTDLTRRPELARLHHHIALWSDRYTPPAEQAHEDLARHPYLGPGFEFTEKSAGEAPYLGYLFNYTFGCLLSLGFGGASISGMKYSLPRVVGGVTRSLFVEDREAYFDSLSRYDVVEFEP